MKDSDHTKKLIQAVHEPALQHDDKNILTDQLSFNRRQEKVFDQAAPFFASDDAATREISKRLAHIVDLGLPSGIKRVLDVGAGCGALITPILQLQPSVDIVAIDLSAQMLSVLKTRFPHIHCENLDILEYHTPLPFDCIWCNACFGNFYNPVAVIKHLSTLLAKGATLNISHPMGWEFQHTLHNTDPLTVPHNLPSTETEAITLAQEANLQVIDFLNKTDWYLLKYRKL